MRRPHRLTVRTSAFQAGNPGSIPGGVISMKNYKMDKVKYIRSKAPLTRAPRLKGKVKRARTGSKRGRKVAR